MIINSYVAGSISFDLDNVIHCNQWPVLFVVWSVVEASEVQVTFILLGFTSFGKYCKCSWRGLEYCGDS